MTRDGIEGARDGHDRNPSAAAEDHVLMTPSQQGPRTRVGQGPRAPKVERRLTPIVSGPVEVGVEAVDAGPQRLQ